MSNKILMLVLIFITYSGSSFCQIDSAMKRAFHRISSAMMNYKLDTTTPPDDKITRKINELRILRGGFNIDEAINFKLEEDRQKKEMPDATLNELSFFFKTGSGKTLLQNAITWIYRNNFNYKDLKRLVKFYSTSAGQKMADNFPVIMLQSLAAAEQLKNGFLKK